MGGKLLPAALDVPCGTFTTMLNLVQNPLYIIDKFGWGKRRENHPELYTIGIKWLSGFEQICTVLNNEILLIFILALKNASNLFFFLSDKNILRFFFNLGVKVNTYNVHFTVAEPKTSGF